MQTKKFKTQITLRGKAIELYRLLSSGTKSKAIEKALILLSENKELREIFFDDIEAVEEILHQTSTSPIKQSKNAKNQFSSQKEHSPSLERAKDDEKYKNKKSDDEDDVVEGW